MFIQKIMTGTTRLGTSMLLIIVIGISACGGGGGGGGGSKNGTTSFTVGGTISGLVGSVVLQNNHGDNLTLTTNAPFTFSTAIANGNTYEVTVLAQPTGLTCTVGTGSGTIFGSNITNVTITCATKVYSVSTLAGAASGLDAIGTLARFTQPTGVTSDGTNLYVVDEKANKIRKIVIATGVVTTLAGSGVAGADDGAGTSASFFDPLGITIDDTHTSLYVTDLGNNKIRKIVIATGVVTSLTGRANTASVSGATDGPAASATFYQPYGITTDGSNLYVADHTNHKIRKVVIATGEVSSFTGSPNIAGSQGAKDGAPVSATFTYPGGITTDHTYLYVADSGNNKIRKILIADGTVSSVTGTTDGAGVSGAADGTATSATFNWPYGITTYGASLYVSDSNNNKIRQVDIATGAVSSFTGATNTAGAPSAVDGPGASATFNYPVGITTDGTNLYVADAINGEIRAITISTPTVSTKAGAAAGTDGMGAAATFRYPGFVTSDGSNLYITDAGNHKIRKIVIATGEVTTLAGTGVAGAADGPGISATFDSPNGIAYANGNLYVADYGNNKIRKIVIATGEVSSLTGGASSPGPTNSTCSATPSTCAVDGAAGVATFNGPTGIATDGTNLYMTDYGNNKIRKIVISTGEVSSLTGVANTPGPTNSACTATPSTCAVDGAAGAATFNELSGIVADGTNLYVSDAWNHKIRKILIATGEVSSFTGIANTAGVASAVDGTGTNATFNYPTGITADAANLYVSDTFNHKIRKVEIATGVVSSVTGLPNAPGVLGAADGLATTATFNAPFGIVSVGTSLYVADAFNKNIRKLQ